MIFTTGTHIKCLLRTSTVVEGIVQDSSSDEVVLKSLDGKSLLIIHQPEQDIVLTKVVLFEEDEEIPQENEESKSVEPVCDGSERTSEQVFCKIDTNEDPDEDPIALHVKSIAELKVELAQQERKIIAEKLRDHHLQGPRKVIYGQPGFFQKPRTK